MRFYEVITKRIEHDSDGLSLAGVLSAAVAANVNERGTAGANVRTHRRIVPGGGADPRRSRKRRQP
jgi:hypothetical protein